MFEEFAHFFQESILSDLKNGVNPQSKNRVFHITRDNMYDSNDLIPDDMPVAAKAAKYWAVIALANPTTANNTRIGT